MLIKKKWRRRWRRKRRRGRKEGSGSDPSSDGTWGNCKFKVSIGYMVILTPKRKKEGGDYESFFFFKVTSTRKTKVRKSQAWRSLLMKIWEIFRDSPESVGNGEDTPIWEQKSGICFQMLTTKQNHPVLLSVLSKVMALLVCIFPTPNITSFRAEYGFLSLCPENLTHA